MLLIPRVFFEQKAEANGSRCKEAASKERNGNQSGGFFLWPGPVGGRVESDL